MTITLEIKYRRQDAQHIVEVYRLADENAEGWVVAGQRALKREAVRIAVEQAAQRIEAEVLTVQAE